MKDYNDGYADALKDAQRACKRNTAGCDKPNVACHYSDVEAIRALTSPSLPEAVAGNASAPVGVQKEVGEGLREALGCTVKIFMSAFWYWLTAKWHQWTRYDLKGDLQMNERAARQDLIDAFRGLQHEFMRAMEAQGWKIVGSCPEYFQLLWNEARDAAVRRAAERKPPR